MRFVEHELAGRFQEADRLLQIPASLAQFRDQPAFVPGRRPDSLNEAEFQVIRALGALITTHLSGCDRGWFGVVASIHVRRPDFLKLFPGRTEGVSVLTPRNAAERAAFLATLRDRFGEISRIPMFDETVSVPVVETPSGAKVGLGF
jgi:hypothetical protein